MNNSITPTLTRAVAREKYLHDIESWKNFAQRITKNPFVKAYLLQRDGKECSWCQKKLAGQYNVHHITYDHYCSFDTLILIPAPTLNNADKKRSVPDCEKCKQDATDHFLSCMDKLILVHSLCNKDISGIN